MQDYYRQDLHISLGHEIISSIQVIQYDTAREIRLYLDDYIPPKDSEIRIYIKKPSGKEVYNHCALIDDEIIVYPTTQMFAECGTNIAQIQIVKDNKIVTSFLFNIYVSEGCAENAILSTNEFMILDALIIEARNIIAAEASRVEAENIRIDNENIRINNENSRSEAESNRSDAEKNRVLAEISRAASEKDREDAELKRQDDMNVIIKNCDTAILNADNAAENANDAASTAIKISEDIEQKAQNGDFSATIANVKAESGEPGTEAKVENTGTAKDAELLFTIPQGESAGFGTISATVSNTVGTPSIEVSTSGTNKAKNFHFTFNNLKGEKGDKGDIEDIERYARLLKGYTLLQENADMNDYKSPGNYCIYTSSIPTIKNLPPLEFSDKACIFFVEEGYTDGAIIEDPSVRQRFQQFMSNKVWERYVHSDEWSDWILVSDDQTKKVDVADFENLSDTIDAQMNKFDDYTAITKSMVDWTSILTVSPEKQGAATQKKYAIWQNASLGWFDDNPLYLQNTDSVVYRDVLYRTENHVLVVLTEAYPVAGRVWTNFYSYGQWLGWKLKGENADPIVINNFDDPPEGEYWFNIANECVGTLPPVPYGFIRVTPKKEGSPRMMVVYGFDNAIYTRIWVNGAWNPWNTVKGLQNGGVISGDLVVTGSETVNTHFSVGGNVSVGGTISNWNTIISKNGKVYIVDNSEGGNIRIVSPNGRIWEMDAYNGASFRLFTASNTALTDYRSLVYYPDTGLVASDTGMFAQRCRFSLLWSGSLGEGGTATFPTGTEWTSYVLFGARTSDGATMLLGMRTIASGNFSYQLRLCGAYSLSSGSAIFETGLELSGSTLKVNKVSMHTLTGGGVVGKVLNLVELYGLL